MIKRSVKKHTDAIRRFLPLALGAILLLAAVLRFYRIADLLHWTLDEEYWSYIPYNIATRYHIPLIGGHISGTGLYSGPLFVWTMAVPFFVGVGHPLGTAFFVSSLGVATVAVMYIVGRRLFDRRVGLIASLFTASSFLWVIFDRKYWNATPIPLLSLLTILSLHNIAKGKKRWALLLAASLAMAFHAHMTSAVLLMFAVIGWFVLKLPLRGREVRVALAGFLLLQMPLALFELRHGFVNTKALMGFLTGPAQRTPLLGSIREVITLTFTTMGRLVYAPLNLDLAKELTLCSQYATQRYNPPIWAILLAAAALAAVLAGRKKLGNKLMLLMLGVNVLGLIWYRTRAGTASWYPGQLSEYYLFPSFPVVSLSLAVLIAALLKRLRSRAWIAYGALGILAAANASAVLTATHSDGFAGKAATVRSVIAVVDDEPFSLSVESDDPCRIYGYRYLFTVYGREPVRSYLDDTLGWLYQERLPEQTPTKRVTIVTDPGNLTIRVED